MVVAASGAVRVVLEVVGTMAVVVVTGAAAGGVGVTTDGDPVADANVVKAGVVDGLAIVGGSELDVGDVDVAIDDTVAVITAMVSGIEPCMPAQILYTDPSESVEEQLDIMHCNPASPSANPEGFDVVHRNSSDDVFAQLVLYSVTMKFSTQLRAQAGTAWTTSDGIQELCLSLRASFARFGVHDD